MKRNSFISDKKLHVFIADDDPDDIDFFKLALSEASKEIKITIARDGMELLEFLQLVIPDIIFLDINMPCMNGIDCLSEIRKNVRLKDIPVIIYSTTAEAAHVDLTYSLGANLFIKKPSNYVSIRDTIKNTLSLNMQDLIPQRSKQDFVVNIE